MYNGQVINVLLKERGLRAKDLLEHLNYSPMAQSRRSSKATPPPKGLRKLQIFLMYPSTRCSSEPKVTATM